MSGGTKDEHTEISEQLAWLRGRRTWPETELHVDAKLKLRRMQVKTCAPTARPLRQYVRCPPGLWHHWGAKRFLKQLITRCSLEVGANEK